VDTEGELRLIDGKQVSARVIQIVATRSPPAQWLAILWGDFSEILLSSTSAQLRATAYAALSYVPGTQVIGNETDQLGQPGIAGMSDSIVSYALGEAV
jgi:hypothetical protein